ncbi:MAG: serine hydrolase domain-containing protein [Pseudomonadota bacterium]
MHVRRLILFCFAAILPLAVGAAEVPATDAAIRELARTWLTENGGVGLSIGVFVDGQRRFYNFGATQLDGNKPPTKDTIYEIGPISKTLTGQLLARAIIEGRAALNDEAAKYLDEPYPNLENDGEKIRLIHLANMTSQLADNIPDVTQVRSVPGESLVVSRMKVFGSYTRPEFLRQLHRVAPRRAPGSDPAHSNVGSVLLGVVLEKIYGEQFERILIREIEKPLRMGSGTQPNAKLLAKGYSKDGEELPPYVAPMSWASGALRYSADDLLKFASWQAVERDASVKFAHQPTWFTLDRKQAVAFYWIIAESPQGRRLMYSGGTDGFTSVCDLYPDKQVALVLLSNKAAEGAQGSLRALSAKIVGLLRPADQISPLSSEAVLPAGR